MQLSKVLNPTADYSKRFVFWVGRKLKQLLLHIIKHPLGSIFWVVKAYLALMFLSIFVACSFGAFAEVPSDLSDYKLPKTGDSFCAETTHPATSVFTTYACESTKSSATSKAAPLYAAQLASLCSQVAMRKNCSVTVASTTETSAEFNLRYDQIVYQDSKTGEEILSPQNLPNYRSTTFSFKLSQLKSCPPDAFPLYTLAHTVNNEMRCYKPISDAKKCWPAGGDWEFAPQYFFTHGSSSMETICALKDDNSGQKCPWKKVGTGVYVPHPTSTRNCTNDPNPPEPPAPNPDPAKCVTGGNGLKVCDANPNEKCTANSTGALSCSAKCGYVNNQFFCFDNPNQPNLDPSLPDKDPLNPVDDSLPDASKLIADMTKGDFKGVLKGAEGRLDNLLTEIQNGNKTTEAQLDQLLKKEGNDSKDDALLKSIDENTNAIKESLQGDGNNQGGTKPEFTEPQNNWSQRNFGTIMKEKADQILALPLFTSVRGFFNVSFGGSCPTYSVSVWVFEIQIDQFCSAQMTALWPYIKAVVLLLCSFFAIRIALL